jgi:parvulin-like peptidyl-prolyl isomerase
MRTADRLAAALLAAALAAPAAGEEIARIVLRVNDRIATLADYAKRRDARLAAVARAGNLAAEERRQLAAEAGRSAMRELFEELLVLSRAEQLRLEASPAEIDRAVESARRRFGIESDEEFERGLVESGSSIGEFRARMAQNLLFNEVLQREIQPRIKLDEEEIARYWRERPDEFRTPERRKVEEVVVRDATGTPEERRALAVALRDRLVAGESIADALAAEGAGERALVLDHGWIERGTLDAALETVAWELAAGGVGGPIDGRGGLHVLRVVELEASRVRALDEVRTAIDAKLREGRFEQEAAEYLDELAAKAFVVEQLPPDAVGYRTVPAGERDPVRALLRGSGAPSAPEKAPAEESSPASPPAE